MSLWGKKSGINHGSRNLEVFLLLLNVVENSILPSQHYRIFWRINYSMKCIDTDQRTEVHTKSSLAAGGVNYLCLCFQSVMKSSTPPWYSTNAFE